MKRHKEMSTENNMDGHENKVFTHYRSTSIKIKCIFKNKNKINTIIPTSIIIIIIVIIISIIITVIGTIINNNFFFKENL